MSGEMHGGHRARMKQRYRTQGLDGFDDHNVLELLLYYAIPRQDVNPIAHRLMERFGSLRAVFDASPEELQQVPGVGENAATLIKLMTDVNRRYLIDRGKRKTRPCLGETQAAGEFFLPYFHGIREERVYVAFLDDAFRLLACREMFEGGVNFAMLSVRKLVEAALAEHATNLILAHNHPAGQALPSFEDRETTLTVARALQAVQLNLLDHIIVAEDEYISMEECGYFARK